MAGACSLRDSLWLTFTTVLSNGAGASLGMEAGYSQLGAGFIPGSGRWFRLRRADLRIFVTAGAGAAIAAAFNAPLAGAFYGYELILGSYTTRALAPVVVADGLRRADPARHVAHEGPVRCRRAASPSLRKAISCSRCWAWRAAGVAVLAMQARDLDRTRLAPFQPAGLAAARARRRGAVGDGALCARRCWAAAMARCSCISTSAGRIAALAILLAAKLVASAISVGAGFRGGLFSSALFIGTLLGALFAPGRGLFLARRWKPSITSSCWRAWARWRPAIIGAPLTMVFLVLEATGDFQVTIAVVIAVTVASTIVRIMFGYSFATWRFHLRGLSIRGAHDVGWISDMTVGRLMRTDPKTVPENLGLQGAARRLSRSGGTKRHLCAGRAKAIMPGRSTPTICTIRRSTMRWTGRWRAIWRRSRSNSCCRARISAARWPVSTPCRSKPCRCCIPRSQRRVLGYVTEAYALKRYTQELERMRSAELGQRDLFSIGPLPATRPA